LKKSEDKSFTLIELLIVVAIIAILAAIAIPNFLEAQVRSKVSRVKADFRSLATAIESYSVDWSHYPPDVPSPQFALAHVRMLTTPQAYFSKVDVADPFMPSKLPAGYQINSYAYFNAFKSSHPTAPYTPYGFNPTWGDLVNNRDPNSTDPGYVNAVILSSWGPNTGKGSYFGDDGGEWVVFGLSYIKDGTIGYDRIYDPTNGTISGGDIVRIVGEQKGIPYRP